MILPLLLYDILLFIISVLTYGSAILLTFNTASFFYNIINFQLFLLLTPAILIIFLFYLILSIWVIRLLTPKLKEGSYDAPNSNMFYIWTIHFTLNRMVSIQPIKNIILYSVNLRYLMFRALGGKIAYGCSISADTDLNDLQMISIGKNCVVGACTFMTGHFINKGKITFGKITIENDVNIGGFCHISPNVSIAQNAWIGAETKISPLVKIGKNARIEPASLIKTGTRISDDSVFPE
ncbi:MAG: hypothetical protein AABZ74_16190 [Cyanobacteriota bacterium]